MAAVFLVLRTPLLQILLIAPDNPDFLNYPEIRSLTSLHRVHVLSGPVTSGDVLEAARRGADLIHFATHGNDEGIQLTSGEMISVDAIAQVIRLAGAKSAFFNACESGRLANYAVNHGTDFAIYHVGVLHDPDAWRMAIVFYETLADQVAQAEIDIPEAFAYADPGTGYYGLAVAPDLLRRRQQIAKRMDVMERRDRIQTYAIVGLGGLVTLDTGLLFWLAGRLATGS